MVISLSQTYDIIETLNRAATPEAICDSLTGFTGCYGLTSMVACTIPARHERTIDAQSQHLLLSAYPSEWRDRYLDQRYVHVDPIVRRLQHDFSPFLWSEAACFGQEEHAPVVKRMFGEAGDFHLKAGVAVPMITPDGLAAVVSLGGETIDAPPEIRGMIDMIGTFAIGRAIELRNQDIKRRAVRLTPREIECLRWAGEGKSEWEISTILNISECTVEKHLVHARRKLQATNRTQAVASAIRLGLIY